MVHRPKQDFDWGSESAESDQSSQNQDLLEQRIWWQAVGEATRYGMNLRRELCAELFALERSSGSLQEWKEICRIWTPIKLTVALESFSCMAGQPFLLRLMNALVREVPSDLFDAEFEGVHASVAVNTAASLQTLSEDERAALESALSLSDGSLAPTWNRGCHWRDLTRERSVILL